MELITPTPTRLVVASATATCTTAIPDKFGYVPPTACNANYGFYPKWQDNMAFAIAFAVTTGLHVFQAVKFKKPFCWVIIMGASWECFCFVLRTLGARNQQVSMYVMISTLLFLLAPLWINAFAYMIIARLVYFLEPKQQVLRIPATRLAKGFVSADIVCFLIQAVGGALMAGGQDNKKNADLGKKIYMVGCSVQLAFVVVFIVIVAAFYRSFVAQEDRAGTAKARSRWAKALVWAVFVVLVLIVERIIFRLIEFSRGASSSNPMLRHEWFQLYLDALPMLVAIASLNVVHPGLVLKGPGSSMPAAKVLWWRHKEDQFESLPLSSVENLHCQGDRRPSA